MWDDRVLFKIVFNRCLCILCKWLKLNKCYLIMLWLVIILLFLNKYFWENSILFNFVRSVKSNCVGLNFFVVFFEW